MNVIKTLMFACISLLSFIPLANANTTCDVVNKYVDSGRVDDSFSRDIFQKQLHEITDSDLNAYRNMIVKCAKQSGKDYYGRANVQYIDEFVDRYFVEPLERSVNTAKTEYQNKINEENLKQKRSAYVKGDLNQLMLKVEKQMLSEQEYTRLRSYADTSDRTFISTDEWTPPEERERAIKLLRNYNEKQDRVKEEAISKAKSEKSKAERTELAYLLNKYKKISPPKEFLSSEFKVFNGNIVFPVGYVIKLYDKVRGNKKWIKRNSNLWVLEDTATNDVTGEKYNFKFAFNIDNAKNDILLDIYLNNKAVPPSAALELVLKIVNN